MCNFSISPGNTLSPAPPVIARSLSDEAISLLWKRLLRFARNDSPQLIEKLLGCLQTGRSVIRYGLARHSRGLFEETKSWLRKLIRRKVLSESNAREYKAIVEKLGPKLKCVHQ